MRWAFAAILVLLSPVCRGDSISFPLGGYFHPGRAMPVRWNVSRFPTDDILELSADGAIKSVVNGYDRSGDIFPWIVLSVSPSNIELKISGKSTGEIPLLKPLADDQKLVAVVDADEALAGQLFPNNRNFTVQIEPADSSWGPAMAWQTADAIVLSQHAYLLIPSETTTVFVAAGITLAVTGDSPPDSILPWKHEGNLWIASSGLPAPALIDPDVYGPTYGWHWGRSTDFRFRVVLLGVLFCIILGSAGLWKWRGRSPVILFACGGCFAAFAWENSRWSPVLAAGGMVVPKESHVLDSWTYFQSPTESDFHFAGKGLLLPIFADARQVIDSKIQLTVQNFGAIEFGFHLSQNAPLAMVSRQFLPQGTELNAMTESSPLRQLPFTELYPNVTAAIISSHPPE